MRRLLATEIQFSKFVILMWASRRGDAPVYTPVLMYTIQSGLQLSMRCREGGMRRCHHLVTQSLVGVGAYIM